MSKQKHPKLNEIATTQDAQTFVLPLMNPDEIDRFINYIYKQRIKPHQYAAAGQSFRRSIYNQYARRYGKKTI